MASCSVLDICGIIDLNTLRSGRLIYCFRNSDIFKGNATMANMTQLKNDSASNIVPTAIRAAKLKVNVESDARVYAINPVNITA